MGKEEFEEEHVASTDRLRVDMSRMAPDERFSHNDFAMYEGIQSMLYKMHRRKEIIHVGWLDQGTHKLPCKTYIVGALRMPGTKPPKKKTGVKRRTRCSIHPAVAPYIGIWPEMFRIPEFKIKGTQRNVMAM